MTDEAEIQDLEDLETEQVEEQEEGKTQDPESEAEEVEAVEEAEELEEDDDLELLEVSIGDTPSPEDDEKQAAPEWVKELRRAKREQDRELKEARARIAELESPQKKQIEVGEKPTLEKFNYDEDAYDKALLDWQNRKREATQQELEVEKAQKAERDAWQNKIDAYKTKRDEWSSKTRDFEDAEAEVDEKLNQIQSGIVLSSDDPAKMIYALGKNPSRLKQLSEISDPVAFALALGKLDGEIKVKSTAKAKAPTPEKVPRGSAPVSTDKQLEKLKEEASKTGNFDKLLDYKRKLKAKK